MNIHKVSSSSKFLNFSLLFSDLILQLYYSLYKPDKKQRDKNMSLAHFLGHDNYGEPGNCEDGGPLYGSTTDTDPVDSGTYGVD